jgi:hypothetical protein
MAHGEAASVARCPAFEPIPDTVILIADEQLEALGTIFCSSPLRGSMTFEAYLFVKELRAANELLSSATS